MNRIDFGNRYAFNVELPHINARPNPDIIACIARWNLRLPGEHAFWDRYTLMACSLADFPGVPPASKRFPEATHEIDVFAISPEFDQALFDAGAVAVLEPVNHSVQIKAPSDAVVQEICERMAWLLVHQFTFAEPSGISGARDQFENMIHRFLKGLS